MKKQHQYICVHGHFYQPPREHASLESIETQASASPFHDWNERITAECYTPNARARILDEQGRLTRVTNNYSRTSFNFGPTLLSWLEEHSPQTYAEIIDADKQSAERFGGHGSAMAQVYNHIIMPLANERDKLTQVRWGIADFKKRYGRDPEGMWLAETAADTETLEVLAAHDIKFTILAPNQAAAIRKMGSKKWTELHGDVDSRRPYRVSLPSGRTIDIFFYDGSTSQAVAFEKLLSNGEGFYKRLKGCLDEKSDEPQLVHIATDGETYGHHHRYGEMGLAWTLHLIENDPEVSLINYGQYLELHPPEWEAQIVEKSSWSCAHGVERWRSDCGCNSGANPQWRQAWRAPLRRSLDWLRDRAVELFVSQGDGLFVDPWAARDAYISVIFDRSNENQDKFLSEHLKDELTSERRINALRLLEIQRHAQLMFTSCGWFFDDVAGIETTQVLQYAARVIQLYEMISNLRVEKEFIRRLKNATGNRVQFPDGAAVYEKQVLPDRVGLQEVAAHYAVSSLFEDYGKEEDIFGYHVKRMNYNKSRAGRATFAMGTVEVTSQTTQARTQLCFGVLHFGDHNFAGGVHQYVSQKNYGKALQELTDAFERADLPSVVRFLDDHFSGQGFSLDSLFLDEQEKIVGAVLANTVEDLAGVYRQLYESNGPLIRYLSNLRAKLPNALRMAAEYVLSEDLHEAITQPEWDLELIQRLVERAEREHLRLDADLLVPAANAAVASVATRLIQNPQDLNLIQRIRDMIRMLDASPVKIPLQTIQDAYLRARKDDFEEVSQKSSEGHDWATQWLKAFNELGQTLNIA